MEILNSGHIKDAVCSISKEHPVARAYLFGSYARGEADGSSDIDLCIEPEKGFSLFTLGAYCLELEKLLGRHVDVVCGSETFYPRARERFDNDKVLLYERG